MIIELKKINRRKISNELAKDLREICKVLFKLLFFLLILFLLNETSGFTVNRFTVFFKRFHNCQIEFWWDCIGQKCAQKDGRAAKKKFWSGEKRVEILLCAKPASECWHTFFYSDETLTVSLLSYRTTLRLESLEDAVVLESEDDLLTDKHGCPAYVSPEILRTNSQYSGRAADMWGLGVMLYTMLVGRWVLSKY